MTVLGKFAKGGLVIAGTGLACAGTLALGASVLRMRSDCLRGKIVLITGGSRGLGLALAEEFGLQGAKLALTARNAEELNRARALLVERGAAQNEQEIFVISGDLREEEDAQKVIHAVTNHFGRIDILVNNAGIITVGPVENQSADDFRNVMAANFFSMVYCTLAVLPQMLHRRAGAIVNIASFGGKVAVPHLLPYTASKFAAVGFSEGINTELRARGIRVTTVCPGLMRTGSHLNALFSGDAEREYRWFSLGASLPGVSTSSKSAARQILRAVIAGRNEIAITPQAEFVSRVANLSPSITSRIMQLVNFALPAAVQGQTQPRPGFEARGLEATPILRLGHAASLRYNQIRTSAQE
ncbi:MAG TPA: SDR family NAD(P)-dependent oxidoreductase [Alloacidobacterium sp.]|nr:SDR family NAD(P)-dependent oxidoreductase [Alloacidobacterium sp.]